MQGEFALNKRFFFMFSFSLWVPGSPEKNLNNTYLFIYLLVLITLSSINKYIFFILFNLIQ